MQVWGLVWGQIPMHVLGLIPTQVWGLVYPTHINPQTDGVGHQTLKGWSLVHKRPYVGVSQGTVLGFGDGFGAILWVTFDKS